MRFVDAISVVVPTYNEVENVSLLVSRIDSALRADNINYEIVFVDDHSYDGTVNVIKQLQKIYPIKLHLKQGKKGKAYSLLEGFSYVSYQYVCMIDADLQYPPEAISDMYRLLHDNEADIVLTKRVEHATGIVRRISSAIFNLVFARLLFGFNYDTQSGLKLFNKKVLSTIRMNPTPWSFDLEFIVRGLEQNYKILSYDIEFGKRYGGNAKVNVFITTFELAWASLVVRMNSSTKDIKRAYRLNMEISKKALSLLTVVLAAAMWSFLGNSTQATYRTRGLINAQSLNIPTIYSVLPLSQNALGSAFLTALQPGRVASTSHNYSISFPRSSIAEPEISVETPDGYSNNSDLLAVSASRNIKLSGSEYMTLETAWPRKSEFGYSNDALDKKLISPLRVADVLQASLVAIGLALSGIFIFCQRHHGRKFHRLINRSSNHEN